MNDFIRETRRVLKQVDQREIDAVLKVLRDVRERGGRLFFCGNGGGAGHASHATCDFRKIAGFEAYCVNDNVSELTARINDDGWGSSIDSWLVGSRFNNGRDLLFVFSVGGGGYTTSQNITNATRFRKTVGIVGARGGRVANWGRPIVIPSTSTPIVEGIQAVLWHHLVTELASC